MSNGKTIGLAVGIGLAFLSVPVVLIVGIYYLLNPEYPPPPFHPYQSINLVALYNEVLASTEQKAHEALTLIIFDRKYVRARKLAEEILAEDPQSLAGRYVMANAVGLGDGNLPKALFEARELRHTLEEMGERAPGDENARAWYAMTLWYEMELLGDMDRREEQLRATDCLGQLGFGVPHLRVWPLMKLKRWEEAEEAVRESVRTGDPEIERHALNGKTAMEFERRRRQPAYDAAQVLIKRFPDSAVFWSNFGEAALVVFRPAEAEQAYLTSVEQPLDFHGTPWLKLAFLYISQGRLAESVGALDHAKRHRMTREPYTLQQDQAELNMALASLVLVLGQNLEAERFSRRVYEKPDRAGSTSAEARLLELHGGFLMYSALCARREELREQAVAYPWKEDLKSLPSMRQLDFEIWSVRQEILKILLDGDLLVESLRPYIWGLGAWFTSFVLQILPPGVAAQGLRQAREREDHPAAESYFTATEAEIEWRRGRARESYTAATRALEQIPPAGEKLLRARVSAVAAAAADRLGDPELRLAHLLTVLRDFPAVLRLLSLSVPVSIAHDGTPAAVRLADLLGKSPRFEANSDGFSIRIETSGDRIRFEMRSPQGEHLFKGETPIPTDEKKGWVSAVEAFHQKMMSPVLDLSQQDINSLDGNLGGDRARGEIKEILGED